MRRRVTLACLVSVGLVGACGGRSDLGVGVGVGVGAGGHGGGGGPTSSTGSSSSTASSSSSGSASSASSSASSASSSSGATGFCGDGKVDPGEECDDGNQINSDACVNCQNARCGDGFVEQGVEQCDDGNQSNTDGCTNACKDAVCGDGFVEQGVEQCDDGNTDQNDGCHNDCTLPACGDGILDPGEPCDLGPANADRPALQLTQGALVAAVPPLDKAGDAATFYDYVSASGHTGFEALQRSELFFYRDTGAGTLSLIIEHGIDFDSSGQTQPASHTIMDLLGLPAITTVALSDDAGELTKPAPIVGHGDWSYSANVDGGVISGFPLPGNWKVTVNAQFLQGITGWVYIQKSGAAVPLQMGLPVVLSAFDSPSACRTDCTVPTCGDGILDGGEVCDDGNTVGGDGCAADCKSLD